LSEEVNAMTTRKIEVFSAGCPLCKDTVELVNRLSCPSCDVTVVDMQDIKGASRARELGVKTVPAVAINSRLADCCAGRGPDETTLREAGLGIPIG
jgi:glutaredoxin 3